MFPTTITIHNMIDLQRVIAALAPTAEPTVKAEAGNAAKGQRAPSVSASKTAAETQSATTSPAADVKLTKTQTEAMDETAGLGNAQPAATPAPTAPTASAAAADAPAPKAITYAELQAAVLKLHKADNTAAAPIAQGMGFANFKAMPEDKWPAALAAVQAALSERGLV